MAGDGLQSRPLCCDVGNARVVEAIRHNPDAPGFSVGRHRPDDAKPDRSRPGKSPRATHRSAGYPTSLPDGCGLWVLVHLIGDGDVALLVFFAVWAVVALAGQYRSIESPGVFWPPPGSRLQHKPPSFHSQQLPPGEISSCRAKS